MKQQNNTCIFPLLSQFLSWTSSLSVTTRWFRLVNVVLDSGGGNNDDGDDDDVDDGGDFFSVYLGATMVPWVPSSPSLALGSGDDDDHK